MNNYVVVEVNKEDGHLTYLTEEDGKYVLGDDIEKAALLDKGYAEYLRKMWSNHFDGNIYCIMKKDYNVTFNANEMGAIHALISTIKESVDSDMYIIYEKNTEIFDRILKKIWEANY